MLHDKLLNFHYNHLVIVYGRSMIQILVNQQSNSSFRVIVLEPDNGEKKSQKLQRGLEGE